MELKNLVLAVASMAALSSCGVGTEADPTPGTSSDALSSCVTVGTTLYATRPTELCPTPSLSSACLAIRPCTKFLADQHSSITGLSCITNTGFYKVTEECGLLQCNTTLRYVPGSTLSKSPPLFCPP